MLFFYSCNCIFVYTLNIGHIWIGVGSAFARPALRVGHRGETRSWVRSAREMDTRGVCVGEMGTWEEEFGGIIPHIACFLIV